MPSMMRIAAAGACVLASASAFAPSGGLPMPVRGNALAASRSTGAPRTGALALKADSEVDPKSLVGKFSRMIENKDLDHLRDGNIRYIPLAPVARCRNVLGTQIGVPRGYSDAPMTTPTPRPLLLYPPPPHRPTTPTASCRLVPPPQRLGSTDNLSPVPH
ncbi:hypothetical protein T484DRAFT_3108780 [Baffinella frigidus]|nr:hypothetical protein T484DRAFT_3108780 [Cryptophyta sp. CCMP2293]